MHKLITDDADLAKVTSAAIAAGSYGIDTEFHRERTYFPKLALVQIAVGSEVYLVDPFEADISTLAPLFESDALCILHAGAQDMEIFNLLTGRTPKRVIDTQIAAGFLGMSSPSLGAVLERYCGVSIPKGDRLTDWLQRPLTDTQCEYAANDVAHLHELHKNLTDELDQLGRTQWALEESETSKAKALREPLKPQELLAKVKQARHLKGPQRHVALALVSWRDERARQRDIPPRQILSDLAIVSLSQRPPKSAGELGHARGVESRHLARGAANEIVEAMADAHRFAATDTPDPKPRELPSELRSAVKLISSWISQLAKDNKIEPPLLATVGDVEQFLRDPNDSRLSVGWRNELAGAGVTNLLEGRAALAFETGKGLVLEPRDIS